MHPTTSLLKSDSSDICGSILVTTWLFLTNLCLSVSLSLIKMSLLVNFLVKYLRLSQFGFLLHLVSVLVLFDLNLYCHFHSNSVWFDPQLNSHCYIPHKHYLVCLVNQGVEKHFVSICNA